MKQNKKINNLVLLVGGLGTRLRPLVSEVPKPMAPVKNKPFLEHILKYWHKRGINNFHLLVGYKGSLIEQYFGSKFNNSNIFYYSDEKLAGTGGALKLFLLRKENYFSDQDFILINGDTWLEVDFNTLILDNEKANNKCIIGVKEVSYNERYGTLKISNKNVLEILPANYKRSFINSGLYIIKSKIVLKYFQDQVKYKFSFESDILPYLIKDKKLIASFSVKTFLDIGIPEDYKKCNNILLD